MKAHPPDRDPELRRAFALDVDAQVALLNAMIGRPNEPVSTAPAFDFRHIGVTLKRTTRALSCLPVPFPDDDVVRLGPDSTQLQLLVNETAVHRSAPRTPEAIAALEALVARCAPHRGIVSVPFAAPKAWKMATVREAIGLMVQHLPECHHDPACIQVWIDKDRPGGYMSIDVSSVGSPHVVTLEIAQNATPAIFFWKYTGTLAQLDAKIAAYRSGADEYSDEGADDDDLDAIEKAARRALHGEGGLPAGQRPDGNSQRLHQALELVLQTLGQVRALIERGQR